MEYPEEIVCRSAYKEKIPFDTFNANEFCVTRRIDGMIADNIDMQNGKPVLDPDCLGVIVQMSVNLLGGLFLPEHTLWVQEGEGKKPWNGQTEVSLKDYPDCYRLHDGEYVYYRTSVLHRANYPNAYQLENKNQYKAYHDVLKKTIDEAFKEGVSTKISVTLMLDSDPTNLNYWHFVMRTLLSGTTVELKNENSYRKMVFSHILCHVLCKEFKVKDMTTGKISPEAYMKSI